MANVGTRTPRAPRRLAMAALAASLVLLAAACQDWSQYGGDPAHDGVASGVTFVTTSNVAQLAQAWTVPTGALPPPPRNAPAAIPVVANGTLFAGTPDGRLIAASTDGATGCSGSPVVCQPLWSASIAGRPWSTTPAVTGNVVYEDFLSATSPAGTLAAFDANGVTNCSGSPKVCQPLWTAAVAAATGVSVANGVVYADDIPTKSVEAFDANGVTNCSGSPKVCQPLWTGAIGAWGIPAVANGRVFVASSITDQSWVAVFDASGTTNCAGSPKVCQPLWTVTLPASSSSSVDVSGGVGYVETDTGLHTSQLVAFDANGATNCTGTPTLCEPLWTADLAVGSELNTPAVSGGRVYAATSSGFGRLEVFDAAGVAGCSGSPVACTPLWSITPSSAPFNSGSPIIVNGLVYMAGAFYDAAGTTGCTGAPPVCAPLWTAGSSTAPGNYVFAAVDKDTLFVGETDGAVHAFRIPS